MYPAASFERLVREFPEDPLPRILLERSKHLSRNRPAQSVGTLRFGKK